MNSLYIDYIEGSSSSIKSIVYTGTYGGIQVLSLYSCWMATFNFYRIRFSCPLSLCISNNCVLLVGFVFRLPFVRNWAAVFFWTKCRQRPYAVSGEKRRPNPLSDRQFVTAALIGRRCLFH